MDTGGYGNENWYIKMKKRRNKNELQHYTIGESRLIIPVLIIRMPDSFHDTKTIRNVISI